MYYFARLLIQTQEMALIQTLKRTPRLYDTRPCKMPRDSLSSRLPPPLVVYKNFPHTNGIKYPFARDGAQIPVRVVS